MSGDFPELPKQRKVQHVVWVINALYNDQWQKTINVSRLHTLGDALDAEKLLNVSPSWDEIRRGNMGSRQLFSTLKNDSLKTFTTRDIFMTWLKLKNEREHDYFRAQETKYVLEKLNEGKSFCTREWLNSRGMIVQEDLQNNVFTTLSKAFGETIQEDVKEELLRHRRNLMYNGFCPNIWRSDVLQENTNTVSWNPIFFCVCANKKNCIVSIQADESHEYRIYPKSGAPPTKIINFGRLDLSSYVYLKCNRAIFDSGHVREIYTPETPYDCSRIEQVMRAQLLQMEGDPVDPNLRGEDLIAVHTEAVNHVIDERQQLQKDVSGLNKRLSERMEQGRDRIKMYDALKSTLEDLANSERQQLEHDESLIHGQNVTTFENKTDFSRAQDSIDGNRVKISGEIKPAVKRLTDVEENEDNEGSEARWKFLT